MKNLIIVIHILLTLLLVGCADKGVYVGEKKDGKRHGQGKFKWSDGDKYVGEFKDGKQDGQGTYTHSDGRKYVGEWKDGKKHGYGTLTYLNGEKYYGEFKDGKRNGQGTLTKPNGDKYVGEFKDGKQDGQGTYTHSDGRKYVGEWKDGYKTGQGTFYTSFGFNFKYNIHSSLPKDWVNEFYLIMNNLDKVIPLMPTNSFSSLDIYTWTCKSYLQQVEHTLQLTKCIDSSTDKPFKNKIGNTTGTSFFGRATGSFMVLEIPADEFKYNRIYRYSLIPHEYFHAFQFSLSNNFFFDIKWLAEGAAASFESLYTQQYYNKNHFKWAQNHVNIAVINNPKIFESYDESIEEDRTYSSSVFMVLALVKELKKLDITEEKAFKLIFNDFRRKNPSNDNWKKVFQEVFNITLEDFYLSLKNYTNDINSVLPSESLKLENIFPPPPPPPKSDTSSPVVKGSGYTSSNASATSNLFVLKEVTSEFSVGDIITFGDSKKEYEIREAKVLKKSESGNIQGIVLYKGFEFKISPGSGNIQGIVIKGAVGFKISPGMKVSVVKETDVEEPVRLVSPNGDVYVGEVMSGEPHGQGTLTLSSGNKYEGEFKDGIPWNGTLFVKNGNIFGKFVNGEWIKN